MPTLWDIDARVLELLAALERAEGGAGEEEGAGGEVLADFAAELDAAQAELAGKLDGVAALIAHLRATAEARKAESNRLAALAKADQNRSERIEAFLLDYLRARGRERVETARYRIGVVRNGGKPPLEITAAPEDLPEEFRRVRLEVDKEALREALEAGEVLPGARLLERGYRLSIR